MLAPIGVFALIAKVVAISGFEGAGPLLLFAGCVVAGLALYGFVALPILLATVARVNPWRLYPAMAPALLTAFSTASSSATLPLSLRVPRAARQGLRAHRGLRHAARRVGESRRQRVV